MVLLIVGLTAATYVAMTLVTALRRNVPALGSADRAARALGITTALLTVVLSLAGLRIGPVGSEGELVPTVAAAISASAALGSSTACALLVGARGLAALGAGRRRRLEALTAGQRRDARWREATIRRRLEGHDLASEVTDADAALERLKVALRGLTAARDSLAEKLAGLGDARGRPSASRSATPTTRSTSSSSWASASSPPPRPPPFASPATSLCAAFPPPPQRGHLGLERLESAAGAPDAEILARLAPAATALRTFLAEIAAARAALDALAARRPASIPEGSEEDPLALAHRDLAALHDAFSAVLARVEVVQVRHAARATIAVVAEAAGAVAQSARSRGEGQSELEALAAEVTRAEAAAIMATPIESDAKALTAALARSTAALGQSDGASLDELLEALRSIA